MPDNNPVAPKDNLDHLLRQLQQAPKAEERFREDAYAKPVLMQQGNCIRCHDTGRKDFNLSLTKPLDFAPIRGFDDLPKRPVDPAELERRAVEKFKTQPIVDKAATILTRLPDKVDVSIDKDKISISTDFVKAIEAIPGIKLPQEAKDHLSKVKSIGFENGVYTIKLDKQIAFKGGTVGPDISFEVKNDTTKPDGVGLKNIKGLKVIGMPVEELSVITDGGKNAVKATGDFLGRKVTHEIDLNQHGASGELLKQAIGKFAEYQPMIQNRDFGQFTKDIPEGFKNTITDMMKGVTSIKKEGDKFTIHRDNGTAKFEFGGPTVSVAADVSFKLGNDPDAPSIKDIRGLSVSIPLPEKIGLGDRYTTNIKGVSLGLSERDGGRSVTVNADNMVDTVKVRLDGNFKPRSDADGNWNLNVGGFNPLSPDGRKDRMNLNIRMGKDGNVNMKVSEILDIVSDLTWQASDVSLTGGSLAVASTYSQIASWISSIFE